MANINWFNTDEVKKEVGEILMELREAQKMADYWRGEYYKLIKQAGEQAEVVQ